MFDNFIDLDQKSEENYHQPVLYIQTSFGTQSFLFNYTLFKYIGVIQWPAIDEFMR